MTMLAQGAAANRFLVRQPVQNRAPLTTVGHDAASFAKDDRVEMRVASAGSLLAVALRRRGFRLLTTATYQAARGGLIGLDGRLL
jgi:hypothetical protein